MTAELSTRPVQLAIFSSHPIQYQIPWFIALAKHEAIDLVVYYGLIPTPHDQGVGFGVPFSWDIPLLKGYRWRQLASASRNPSLRRFFSNRITGLGQLLRRDRPDVAVITGWQSAPLVQALLACRRAGIPCIARGESNVMRSRPRWRRFVQRQVLNKYQHFLAIGKSNRQLYLDQGTPPAQITDCPYFVDNDRFSSEAAARDPERGRIRAEWSIPPDTTCFLLAAKLMAVKRPLDLMAALNITRATESRVHLLIVGDGELRDECRHFAERHALPVTFAGFLNQSEIARAYVASDCMVLPSDYETWGLVVNEAMACGKAAIVSDRVGCGPDLVEHGVTGFVFPFGDVDALADALVAAASDRPALARMGERARARVLADYSVERAVEGTLAAIEAVLARSR